MAIERIMRGLKISRTEAEDVYKYDQMVDHDEKTEYDLSPEKLKESRKYARADRKPTTYKWSTRERKPNATKEAIIEDLVKFLSGASSFDVKNIDIENKERQILFQIGDDTFGITLVQKRKPKV